MYDLRVSIFVFYYVYIYQIKINKNIVRTPYYTPYNSRYQEAHYYIKRAVNSSSIVYNDGNIQIVYSLNSVFLYRLFNVAIRVYIYIVYLFIN